MGTIISPTLESFLIEPAPPHIINSLHPIACNSSIVPAVRDEGTSYHYLEPSREVECHKATADFVISGLEKLGIPYTVGKIIQCGHMIIIHSITSTPLYKF